METEHTVLTVDELYDILEETEDLEEFVFDYGLDTKVELEITEVDGQDRLHIAFGETDEATGARDRYRLTKDSAEQIFKQVKLPAVLLESVPPTLTIPIVNWFLAEETGALKALIKDGFVIAFCSPSTEIYSTQDLVQSVVREAKTKFNLTEVHIDHVDHDLNSTELTLIFPETGEALDNGDILLTGINIRTSVLGKKPLLVSGVIARDYHYNSMISETNLDQWNRKSVKVGSMDDMTDDNSYDVYDWIKDVTADLIRNSDNDRVNVKRLANIEVGDHSTAVQTDIFNKFSIPAKAQGAIRLAFSEEPDATLLSMWNAITSAANNPEIAEKVALIRKLREAGGSVAQRPHTCPSCYRLTGDLDD